MHLNQGTLLKQGKYRIDRLLSSGGFGITYKATNIKSQNVIAIKEFYCKKWHTRDEQTGYVHFSNSAKDEINLFRKKFEKEAKILSSFSHPNIVKVFDYFEDKGTAYYVMEYIDGYSLDTYVKRYGKMTENEALPYIHSVAKTLGYIHSQNELHLDLTPRNIMLEKSGRIVLIDFGVSKHYTQDGSHTTNTPIAHSTGYAPYEQYVTDLKKFYPAVDIYSLSATLLFLVTGKIPVASDERRLHFDEFGKDLLEIPNSLSKTTIDTIIAGMQILRKKRLQTVDAFIKELNYKPSYEQIVVPCDVHAYTEIGLKVQNNTYYKCNQTRYASIFVLCDGMNTPNGEVASLHAAHEISNTLECVTDINSLEGAILLAIRNANDKLNQEKEENPNYEGMETTLALLVLTVNTAYLAHIGNSRIYQLREGKSIFRTLDHSYSYDLVSTGEITVEDAEQLSRRNDIDTVTKTLVVCKV